MKQINVGDIDKANLQNNIENDSIDVDMSLNEIIVSKQLILPQIQLTKSRQGRYIGSRIEKPKNKVPSGRDIKNIPSQWDFVLNNDIFSTARRPPIYRP